MKTVFLKYVPIHRLLLLVYVALLILLFTLSVTEYNNQQKNHHIISMLLNNSLRKQSILTSMRQGSDYVHVNVLRFLYYTDKKAKDKARQIIYTETKKNDSNLVRYEKFITSHQEQQLFNKLKSDRAQYAKKRATLILLIKEGRYNEAVNYNLRFLYNSYENFQKSQSALSDFIGKKDNANIEDNEDRLIAVEKTKIKLNAAIFLLLALLGIMLSRIIKKLKTTNLQLAEREHKYHLLAEHTHEIIYQCDNDSRLVFANDSFKQKLEYSDDEIAGLTVPDFLSEESKHLYKAHPAKSEFGEIISNTRQTFKSKSGKKIIVEGNIVLGYKNNVFSGATAFFNDVTERELALVRLKESNQRFQYATKATSDAIWDWNLLKNTVYWGEGFQAIFGYNLQELKADISSWTDHIHPDDIDRVLRGIHQVIEGDQTNWEDEYSYCKSDQTYAYVIDKGFVIRDEQGKAIRMVGAMRDITKRKNDEFALQQSEARQRGIIASQTNYVIRTDPDGNYTYCNQKYSNDFSWIYNGADLMGMNSMASVMEYHHQEVKDTVEKCFLNLNEVFQVEIDKPSINGGVKTTLWDFTCLTDPHGRPVEIQCVGIDISERKKAEMDFITTLEEKNTILESIRDAFFAVDKNWNVTYWNKEAEKVLGRPKKEILNRNLWEVYSDSLDTESYRKYHQALATHQVVHFEDYYLPLDKWYEISAYPSDNGLSVYFKDVTERKVSEIRLKELNESIQKHVKELAVSNAELEQFAYVASHDLQEPLRMVTSFLTQLENKYGKVIDDKGKKYIEFAVDGAKRMRQIILDLLEFSRAGKMETTREDLDLNVLLNEIQILFRKQTEEKRAVIHAGKLPVIQASKAPIRQVFQNLISNALKYTRQNVPSQIHITAKEFKTYWQFTVTDNGIGISEEYFDKIFVIFQRLHNKDHYPGTGMGLAVTKKIIENQGGKIWVESLEGQGSSFHFTIIKTTK